MSWQFKLLWLGGPSLHGVLKMANPYCAQVAILMILRRIAARLGPPFLTSQFQSGKGRALTLPWQVCMLGARKGDRRHGG